MECGEQCVVMAGIGMMPELCADNWGTVSTQVEVNIEKLMWHSRVEIKHYYVVEIHNGIMFHFYPGLPQIRVICTHN